jgi:hypothetical protein
MRSIARRLFLFLKLFVCSYYVPCYLYAVVILLSNIFVPTDQFAKGGLSFLFTICSIFVAPPVFVAYLGNEVDKWERAYLNIVNLINIMFTLLMVVLWYYFPELTRLESAVAFLGLSAAWIIYIRDRKIRNKDQFQNSLMLPQPIKQTSISEAPQQVHISDTPPQSFSIGVSLVTASITIISFLTLYHFVSGKSKGSKISKISFRRSISVTLSASQIKYIYMQRLTEVRCSYT